MADGHWYALKVRQGFEVVVAQKLRKLDLEVFVPERKLAPSEDRGEDESFGCLYCCFDLSNRNLVLSIPGVVDIMGAPEITPLEKDIPNRPTVARRRKK